jgi:deazaflavin-dependent oxidoreductase (nitroreductase family)
MNRIQKGLGQYSKLGTAGTRHLLRRRLWKKTIDIVLTPLVQCLYRTGLKRWIGGAMVVLTHVGRKSGKVRKTVLHVQDYNPTSKEVQLVAAFGITDWFLNISKRPALLVEIGNVRYVPEQKILTVHEIAALERAFREKHPLVAKVQAWLMGWPWKASDEEFMAFASSLRGLALWPKQPA